MENPAFKFEREQRKPGVVLYKFKHVIVAIDSTGKNYKDLPEIMFGTFSGVFDEKLGEQAMHQPENRRVGVGMEYVSECIKKVAEDTGLRAFWLYPYGNDLPDKKEKREKARIKLFGRYTNITSAPGEFGYIVKI